MKQFVWACILYCFFKSFQIVFLLHDDWLGIGSEDGWWQIGTMETPSFIRVVAYLLLAYFLGFFIFGELRVPSNAVYITKQIFFKIQYPFFENRIKIIPYGVHRGFSPIAKILYTLQRTPITVSETVRNVKSKDGVSHEIKYSLVVQTEFDKYQEFKLHQLDIASLSKSFWDTPIPAIRSEVEDAIRHIVGKFDAVALNRGDEFSKLNMALRDELKVRMKRYHFKPIRGSMGSITAPAAYRKAHLQSHARAYESSAVSKAITEIQKVLNGLPDSDKALLTNMEMISMVLRGQGGSSITLNDISGVGNSGDNGSRSGRYANGRSQPTFGNSSLHVVAAPAA